MKSRIALAALSGLFLVGAVACVGPDQEPEEKIAGTWVAESIQALGLSSPCPGEIALTEDISISCATTTLTFNADGTIVRVETTDDTGAPYDWRTEGLWTIDEELVTVTFMQEGEGASSMQLMDPPQTWISMWSIRGDTLNLGFISGYASVTATYTRQ